MNITIDDIKIFEELVEEFYYQHPQLYDVDYDDNGTPYEIKNGKVSYDSFGAKKTFQILQLSSKLKSLV